MEDREIIRLFFDRSEGAIEAVREKYGGACTRLAANIVHNEGDAEECVSDAYLALWQRIPPEQPEPLAAYILRIVRNLSLKRRRHDRACKRDSTYDLALDELADTVGRDTLQETVDAHALTRALEAFLDTLDRDSRVLFLRRYWYADSVGALAERFGISANLVSVRLSRLRDKLRKYLLKEGITV